MRPVVANEITVQSNEINIPVANMYQTADDNSEVVSQAIYGTSVKILESQKKWVKIQTPDEYQGWVQKADLINANVRATQHKLTVTNLFAQIYAVNDTTPHKPVMTVPFGTTFPIVAQPRDSGGRWIKIRLLNNDIAWIQRGAVSIDLKPLNLNQMIMLSHQFIGLPYTWGGDSSFGFDCSGFTQTLYKQIGVTLPRDATLQMNWSGFVEADKDNLQAGDLLFFGQDNKITHVGMYLRDNTFIDSTVYKTPKIQINHLDNLYWQKMFVAARRLNNFS